MIVSFVFVIQQLARLGEEFLHALTFRRLSTNMLMVFVRTALMCTQIISPKVHDNVARLDVASVFTISFCLMFDVRAVQINPARLLIANDVKALAKPTNQANLEFAETGLQVCFQAVQQAIVDGNVTQIIANRILARLCLRTALWLTQKLQHSPDKPPLTTLEAIRDEFAVDMSDPSSILTSPERKKRRTECGMDALSIIVDPADPRHMIKIAHQLGFIEGLLEF